MLVLLCVNTLRICRNLTDTDYSFHWLGRSRGRSRVLLAENSQVSVVPDSVRHQVSAYIVHSYIININHYRAYKKCLSL